MRIQNRPAGLKRGSKSDGGNKLSEETKVRWQRRRIPTDVQSVQAGTSCLSEPGNNICFALIYNSPGGAPDCAASIIGGKHSAPS